MSSKDQHSICGGHGLQTRANDFPVGHSDAGQNLLLLSSVLRGIQSEMRPFEPIAIGYAQGDIRDRPGSMTQTYTQLKTSHTSLIIIHYSLFTNNS